MHWPSESLGNLEGSAFLWFNISKKKDKDILDSLIQ